MKAQHVVVFNTEALSPLFERVIIASGTSNRQTRALASSVRETVKKRGLAVLRTEGEENGEWIIVDCGAAVAHIMQPAIRDYYHLEEIWGAKPVRLKGPAEAPNARRTAPPSGERPGRAAAAPAAAAKRASASPKAKAAAPHRGVVGAKAGAKKAGAKKASVARPAAKPVGKPARRVATKKAGTKHAATKNVASKPAGRPAPRKSGTRPR